MKSLYKTPIHRAEEALLSIEEDAHILTILSRNVHALNHKWWLGLESGERVDRNVGEMLMLCVSELAEAMEGDRKSLMDDHLPEYEMLHVELADCIIRILDLCGSVNIPIGKILFEKMKYNAVRVDHTLEHRLSENGKKY